jgi:hypothetical protein
MRQILIASSPPTSNWRANASMNARFSLSREPFGRPEWPGWNFAIPYLNSATTSRNRKPGAY